MGKQVHESEDAAGTVWLGKRIRLVIPPTTRTELLEDVQLSCSSTTTTPSTNTVSETVPSL